VSRKVVFVNRFFHPDLSATSQMLSDLAFRLAQNGVDVHVICSRQLYENADARLRPRERVQGVEVHRVWTARFGRTSLLGRAFDYATFYLSASLRLLMLLRAGDVAVVKTDPPMLSIPAAVAVALRGAKLVNWLQDVFPEVASRLEMTIPRFIEVGLQALRDRSLRYARANVVLGARMRDYLRARDIDADRFHIVENWADGRAIQPRSAARSELRAQLGLAERFVVGYSGNLGRAHEYDTILAAAEALRDDPKFVFLMIGGGAKVKALQRDAAARKLANFRFAPYQPREALADSMAAADVHWVSLLPQLEGLIVPSKVYGILAAARPMIFIGDPAGEIAQLIREGDCGLALQPGEGLRLAAELRRLAANPDELHTLGLRARMIFDRRFTLECAADRWMRLLSDLGIESRTDPRYRTAYAAPCA
jgi:glycosyltransferase involved in cell wall biosynthesis